MMGAAAVAAILPFLLPQDWRPVTRTLIGWDIGVILYVTLTWTMMARSDADHMRVRAVKQDVGAVSVLTLTTIAALASIVAIAAELSAAKSMEDNLKILHIAFAGITLVGSWFLVHTVFALHYAFEFYMDRQGGKPAFEFPGKTKEPDFWDFLYISFTIGASSAISDVGATNSSVRRVILAHTILSFFFNTSVLGFAINVGAGLL